MVNSVYSPIQHLAHALFFKHNGNERYFAMIGHTAYFDASGSRGQGEILAVGGYVSSVTRWDKFSEHWGKILAKAGVQEFHMTDFVAGGGEFKDDKWKNNDGYKENFLRKLVNAVCKAAEYCPVVMIYLQDWEDLNKIYRLKETHHSPLALAGGSCIQLIYEWCEKRKIKREHIEFISEDGDLDKGDLEKIVKKVFGFILSRKGKALRPLQACDLIAWEAHNAEKCLSRQGGQVNECFDLSPSLREVINRIAHDPLVYEPNELEKFCIQLGIPRR